MLGQSLEHDLPGLNAADWQMVLKPGLLGTSSSSVTSL